MVSRDSIRGGQEMMDGQQERRYRRFQLGYPVRLQWASDGSVIEVETTSQNLSIGGLLVSSPSVIPEHTPVTFIISVLKEKAIRPIYLAGQGEIVRVEDRAAAVRLAVECKTIITQLEDYLPTA